jgi:DNA repair ATPase RecN
MSKVKLSNEQIINDANKLRAISEKQLPIKASYALAKNIGKIESELKVYNKERNRLLDQYATKDKKGEFKFDKEGQVIFKDGCKEKWEKDIRELLEIENEIDIHKFKINELEGYSISPSELMVIDYMIQE